nr:beta-N-acetylhexosaminidase [Candidatus Eremiobacteraeota bacterium]
MPQPERNLSIERTICVLLVVFISTTSFFSASAAPFRPSSRAVRTTPRQRIQEMSIVPRPREIQETPGSFAWPARTRIAASTAVERDVAALLSDYLHSQSMQAELASAGDPAEIHLRAAANADPQLGSEGYALHITPRGITMVANAGAGLFYALQTLEQMTHARSPHTLDTPAATIEDWPAYRWRGVHLDVSRHFYTVPIVKRYIDVAAHYKLNTFHWHLTDDQGWRIEIKRYPRLTAIGSCRAGTEVGRDPSATDGKRYCGFYTQSQIRDVVTYAKRRNITVVPEIEVPGHSAAALASYPELACKPGPYRVRQIWGTGESDVYCPSERTFAFLKNVLSEVMSMFPSPYVHVGGDEVATEAWHNVPLVRTLMQRERLSDYAAVQAYMMRRMERFLRQRGRRLVGWDEILDGGVSSDATIMSWRGEKPGIRAVRRGNDAVMTPDGPLYFDAYQGDRLQEPRAIGNMSTLEQVYDYDPTPDAVTAAEAAH